MRTGSVGEGAGTHPCAETPAEVSVRPTSISISPAVRGLQPIWMGSETRNAPRKTLPPKKGYRTPLDRAPGQHGCVGSVATPSGWTARRFRGPAASLETTQPRLSWRKGRFLVLETHPGKTTSHPRSCAYSWESSRFLRLTPGASATRRKCRRDFEVQRHQQRVYFYEEKYHF